MPEQSTSIPPVPQNTFRIQDVCEPLYQARGWMRLLGVLMLIAGGLSALTCVGLLFAWLPIWLGVVLMGCATALERAYDEDSATALAEAAAKLKTYFTIMGVTTLVMLVLNLVSFVFILLSGVLASGFAEAFSAALSQ